MQWINNAISLWPTMFANGLVDYVTDYYLRGSGSGGLMWHYLVNGFQFMMKQAAADTGTFRAGQGNIFSSVVSGMFTPNTAGVTATRN